MHGQQDEGRQPAQATPDAGRTEGDTCDPWGDSLEAWVCSLNILRFRALLAEAMDPHQRAILTRLIDEHEASFHRFLISDRPGG